MSQIRLRRPQSVQVFLVALQDSRRSYLLFQRRPMPGLALPSFWQGITGALEWSESFEEAAVREVMEESGISLSEAFSTGFTQYFPIRHEWRGIYGEGPTQVEERVFYALVSPDTQPVLSAEHQSCKWCSLHEALALLEFGQNRRCLQAVEDALSSGNSSPHCTSDRSVAEDPESAVRSKH